MVPFQTGHQPDPHAFKPGVSFGQIHSLYELDRKLRWLVLSAVETIEVAVRVAVCNRLAWVHGPHWHIDSTLFDPSNWGDLERRVAEALEFDLNTNQRRVDAKLGAHLFLDHYYGTYSTPAVPPCWMLMEVASFGLVAKLFSSLKAPSDRKSVALEFAFPDGKTIDEGVLTNWLHSVSVLRNRCAHHSRIVYRMHPFPPKATTNASVSPLFRGGGKLREFLAVLAVLIRAADPKSDWTRRLYLALEAVSDVDVARAVGFQHDWRADTLWSLAW